MFPIAYPRTLLKIGSRGPAVRLVQIRLRQMGYHVGRIDGIFGARTKTAVQAFQRRNNLTPDGIVGPRTYHALFGGAIPGYRHFRYPRLGSTGPQVRRIQSQLHELGYNPGPVDGIFGSKTKQAVQSFQRYANLTPDGIVGPRTEQALMEALQEQIYTPGL